MVDCVTAASSIVIMLGNKLLETLFLTVANISVVVEPCCNSFSRIPLDKQAITLD